MVMKACDHCISEDTLRVLAIEDEGVVMFLLLMLCFEQRKNI